jgi:nucleoside-diphosphate-sugar epimerase
MRVLIVGCGYVGLPLGAELARGGHEVFGLRRSREASAALRAVGVAPLVGDLTRAEDLARLPRGFDWVVNTVSSSHGGAEAYRAVYVEGTRRLLAWLRADPPQKFVYTGSTAVYGQEDGSLVDETSVTAPSSATGRVLREAEELLLAAARAQNFPAVILRVAGIYGPERGHPFKQFVAGTAQIAGDGARVMNMVHRDDVIGAIRAALERGRPGEVYNVVDDEPVTQLEFFRWLSATLNKPMPPVVADAAPAGGQRALTNKRVSNLKLKTQLGYALKYPTFREGYAAGIARLAPAESDRPAIA